MQKTPETVGLKIGRPSGGTKILFVFKHSFIAVKMTAQNTRTQQRNGNVLAFLGTEIFVRMCQNQAVWFGWGFLGSFS